MPGASYCFPSKSRRTKLKVRNRTADITIKITVKINFLALYDNIQQSWVISDKDVKVDKFGDSFGTKKTITTGCYQ